MFVALAGVAACASDDGTTSSPGVGVVEHVIDGDTIDVEIAGRRERVRLLGIDTPEVEHPDSPAECYGDAAWGYLDRLVPPGTEVRLERDIVGRDDYGRLLAHVFRVEDDLFVNVEIVRDGYATPLIIEPNVAYRRRVISAAREAQRARLGLWSQCAN